MKSRMERILKKLAQRHRPYLLNNLPEDTDTRLRLLADGLVKEGVLVIVGEITVHGYYGYDERVSQWVGAYGDLCMLMANGIFPSLAKLDAVFADNNQPPIVVIDGQPTAVMEQLGRYVAPFLAMRQKDKGVTDAELRGLMQFMLDELEAKDVPDEVYTYIWQEGIKILRYLLNLDMTHYAVTSAARPLMLQFPREQEQAIEIPQPPVHPDQKLKPPIHPEMLPDEPPLVEETDSAELFQSNIPLFPSLRRNERDFKRRGLPIMLPMELQNAESITSQTPRTTASKQPHSGTASSTKSTRRSSGDIDKTPSASGKSTIPSNSTSFSIYHPKAIRLDDWQNLFAYVFKDVAAQKIRTDALERLGQHQAGYNQLTQPTSTPIKQGTEITARPFMQGFHFRPASVSVQFYEDWERFDFQVRAVNSPINQFAIGHMIFTVADIIIAQLPISLFVGTEVEEPEINATIARMYQSIFCSYSHEDTTVVERVEQAYRALGFSFLRDITTIRSGEKWEKQIFSMIDNADVFQLFWSEAASKSRYVKQEWEYALKQQAKHMNFIRPVYWTKPIPSVPSELSHIHFSYVPELTK